MNPRTVEVDCDGLQWEHAVLLRAKESLENGTRLAAVCVPLHMAKSLHQRLTRPCAAGGTTVMSGPGGDIVVFTSAHCTKIHGFEIDQ